MKAALLVLLLLVLAAVSTASCVMHGGQELPPAAVRAATFDAALVERGASLAAIGNCRGCHTARGGRAFAGGRPLETPFGTLYSTNITPDPQVGIGGWSEDAFRRAMREGVDREGRHLYPAFPYDHFTIVTDEDNRALYAYLMTRTPVDARPPQHRLAFPMNIRGTVGFWKMLYFRPGPYRPDATRSALWNRGAYLAEGLGHCGSCHTPRNRLGAEERERHFDGGLVEGWLAYAIDEGSQAPLPWDERSLFAYLRSGWHEAHGVSRGPMALVTDDLASAGERDVEAMVHYVLTQMGEAGAARRERAQALKSDPLRRQAAARDDSPGARIYFGACHGCHDGSRPMPFGGLPLALSIGVTGESPRNLVNVILYGLPAVEGEASPVMPGYAGALSEAQVAELTAWLRAAYSDRPPWQDVERIVRESVAAGPKLGEHPVGGAGTDPARVANPPPAPSQGRGRNVLGEGRGEDALRSRDATS